MSHTTTKENEIVVRHSNASPELGVVEVLKLLRGKASQGGYDYQVKGTFEIRITHGDTVSGVFEIVAKATYAKIVPVAQAPRLEERAVEEQPSWPVVDGLDPFA